jgi:hypothetical protein
MRITWDDPLQRFYDSGVSQGVLFTENAPGVAWNGLISVTEGSGQTQDPRYFDGLRYLTRNVSAAFSGTISAFTYPDELEPCLGIVGVLTGQPKQPFNFSFRTNRELHIVYNALAVSPKSDYKTMDESPDPMAFEWAFTTQPVKISGGKPSSHVVIMVDDAPPAAIDELEDLIYGDDENDPSLPEIDDIYGIFESHTTFTVTDNGDGTFTVTGPDANVSMVGADTFQLTADTVFLLPDDLFQVSSTMV